MSAGFERKRCSHQTSPSDFLIKRLRTAYEDCKYIAAPELRFALSVAESKDLSSREVFLVDARTENSSFSPCCHFTPALPSEDSWIDDLLFQFASDEDDTFMKDDEQIHSLNQHAKIFGSPEDGTQDSTSCFRSQRSMKCSVLPPFGMLLSAEKCPIAPLPLRNANEDDLSPLRLKFRPQRKGPLRKEPKINRQTPVAFVPIAPKRDASPSLADPILWEEHRETAHRLPKTVDLPPPPETPILRPAAVRTVTPSRGSIHQICRRQLSPSPVGTHSEHSSPHLQEEEGPK